MFVFLCTTEWCHPDLKGIQGVNVWQQHLGFDRNEVFPHGTSSSEGSMDTASGAYAWQLLSTILDIHPSKISSIFLL